MFTIEELHENTYVVAGDMTICIPLTLEQLGDVKVTVIHTAPTQDHSIKCWFSDKADHGPVDPHLYTSYWHPNRDNSEFAIVCDSTIETSFAPKGWMHPRVPGQFFLNIQNLVNSPNNFVVIVDVADMMPVV